MKKERRKLAAIMFTDIAGYSALSQKDEALALELLEDHRTLLRPVFQKHKGKEVKTIGDGFLVKFSSAVEAVEYAIEIQKTLQAKNALLSPERKIQVRIGIYRLKNIETPQKIYHIVLPWKEKFPARTQPPISLPKAKRKKWSIILPAGVGILALTVGLLFWLPKKITRSRKASGFGIRSLAVLPLQNFSGDPEQEFFADGMTEALIAGEIKVTVTPEERERLMSSTQVNAEAHKA
jgi:adenylate cyclase